MAKKKDATRPPDPEPKPVEPNLSYIAEQLRPLAIRCDSLKPDPSNARVHDAKNSDFIAASLRSFGQTKPIVVRKETSVVVCGNGTLAAAKSLGWEYIAASFQPLTDDQAKALAVADNRAGDLSFFDDAKIAETLAGLSIDDAQMYAMLDDLREESSFTSGFADLDGEPDGRKDMVTKGKVSVRPVLFLDQVETMEKAIALTGLANRADAFQEIFAAYVKAKGQFDLQTEGGGPA